MGALALRCSARGSLGRAGWRGAGVRAGAGLGRRAGRRRSLGGGGLGELDEVRDDLALDANPGAEHHQASMDALQRLQLLHELLGWVFLGHRESSSGGGPLPWDKRRPCYLNSTATSGRGVRARVFLTSLNSRMSR